MSLPDHEPEDGPEAPAETPTRKVPPRGPDPLSLAHRKRVLRALVKASEGDGPTAIQAQQALVELSLAAERDTQIAAALE